MLTVFDSVCNEEEDEKKFKISSPSSLIEETFIAPPEFPIVPRYYKRTAKYSWMALMKRIPS
jgi:hypothetical protein